MTAQAIPPIGGTAPVRAPGRRFVYLAAVFAGLGGLLFGYDTGVISGAELFLKNDFSLSTFALEIIVSGVLAGAAAGALAGGRLADLFGRRLLLIVTAVISALGAVLCAAATSVTVLIAGRIIVVGAAAVLFSRAHKFLHRTRFSQLGAFLARRNSLESGDTSPASRYKAVANTSELCRELTDYVSSGLPRR